MNYDIKNFKNTQYKLINDIKGKGQIKGFLYSDEFFTQFEIAQRLQLSKKQ